MENDAGGLLDTSTVFWLVEQPERVPTRVREMVERSVINVSVVSYWEIVQKVSIGKLDIVDPIVWWRRATNFLGAKVLSVEEPHVEMMYSLSWHHRDPFDRMLVAQALRERLVLFTSDREIAKYPLKVIW